jgi:hypothetical protein
VTRFPGQAASCWSNGNTLSRTAQRAARIASIAAAEVTAISLRGPQADFLKKLAAAIG